VYIVSTTDQPERGLKFGARGVLPKPIPTSELLDEFLLGVRQYVDRTARRVVVVAGQNGLHCELEQLFAGSGVDVVAADSAAAALQAIHQTVIDSVVLTPEVPDSTVASLAERILAESNARERPLFFYVPSDAPTDGTTRWKQLAHEFGLQLVDSPARLADLLARELSLPVANLPEQCQAVMRESTGAVSVLAGKKVMIVDDDIRNIFALTSILERHDIVTVAAETGRDAVNLLQAAPDVDIVLMDIMMPEMDGIDTIRAIRQISHFQKLPIIAVTAKAMKGDREKCIDAGAWDYLAKPVDPEQLLNVLRAWFTD
jgi:CheY-like chemotaxis protein